MINGDLWMYLALALIAKNVIIGGDFNFHKWYKYTREYTDWYFSDKSTFEHYKESNYEYYVNKCDALEKQCQILKEELNENHSRN